ncbi:hypothetical protein VP1G_02330 [Cytospora mali]|uniref:Alpha/beta hydrolase fold-3 domain-containing protein n=1 Tax=Cytospora mali TaxID=578113 RepID=A0A194UTK4_CYTMA|nr:hypothetical protein VP1G_02330 [Valsa mali var. pyri (nom. inval.)]
MAESGSKKAYDPVEAIEPHILAKLDPDFVKYWTELMNKRPPPARISIELVRANPAIFAPACALDTKGYPRTVDKEEVTSEDGAKIPVRIYYPDESKYGPGPYPVHLNFHGGGFVLGDLSNESTLCLSVREGAGVAVVDVNYRHCPENIWGKCFQDAWAALNWTRDEATSLNFKPDSISIGGISAGAHIAIVVQHLARDAGFPLKLMMASVPPTTDGLAYKYYTESPFPSFHEYYRGPVLPWANIKWFGNQTMPEDKQAELRNLWPDWWFAPLQAPNFRGLCPSFIRTGECDPLRDEGEAYGMKLVAGGNDVKIKRYLGSPHTFMALDCMKQKKQYDLDSIAALKEAHGV